MSSHVQDSSGRKKRSPRSTTCSSRPSESLSGHNSEKNQHRENSSGRRNNSGKVGLRYCNYELIDMVSLIIKTSTRIRRIE